MLKNREEILTLLQTFPEARVPQHQEVPAFLDSQKLFGLGLGWVDVNLMASAQLTGCDLWTSDIPLQRAAAKLHLSRKT